MLSNATSASSSTADSREARVQALLEQLRPDAERALRQMAERLVDLPEDGCFGPVEYDLRDLAQQLTADVHQTGLEAAKKKATRAPASSARTARTTPATSRIAPRPG
jgi:50S ribosomal subunit-associated GTPase HflX